MSVFPLSLVSVLPLPVVYMVIKLVSVEGKETEGGHDEFNHHCQGSKHTGGFLTDCSCEAERYENDEGTVTWVRGKLRTYNTQHADWREVQNKITKGMPVSWVSRRTQGLTL